MGPKRVVMDPRIASAASGYVDYKRVIQRSWVHVIGPYPLLSWSLMEAMASGCCIVASATPPR